MEHCIEIIEMDHWPEIGKLNLQRGFARFGTICTIYEMWKRLMEES